MNNFCDSEFWDSNITWISGVLEFTPCFQSTVLTWSPCVFLWIFCGVDFYYISISRYKDIPWNFLIISKIAILIVLICLSLIELVFAAVLENVLVVDIVNPIILIITFCLAGYLLNLNKKNGQIFSVSLFSFWLFSSICSIPEFRYVVTSLQNIDWSSTSISQQFHIVHQIIFYTLIVIQLILSCFAESSPRISTYKKSSQPNPIIRAGIANRLFFVWLIALIWKGYKKSLETNDIYELCPDQTTEEVYSEFSKELEKEMNVKTADKKTGKISTVSLGKVIVKAIKGEFILAAAFGLVYTILEVLSPLILQLLIKFISSNDPIWKGILYAVLFLILSVLLSIFEQQQVHHCWVLGIKTKTALLITIYRKALKKLNISREGQSTGEIVNLMSVDAQRFLELFFFINTLWFGPITVALVVFLLWNLLGPSVLAGLFLLISMVMLSLYIARKLKILQAQQMKFKGERIKMVNEVLNGIKVLKLYAWEPSFEEQIRKLRNQEIANIKLSAIYSSVAFLLWTLAPYLVSLVIFTVYVLSDEKNVLNAETAFVSIALINILKYPMYLFSMLVTLMTHAQVSLKRIATFLSSEEIDKTNISHESSDDSIEVSDGSFSWYDENTILKAINLKVQKGSLVAIVGSVGCGKSSLISAILGEMKKLNGQVNTIGKIAFVPQQAWIQNCTLEKNITFGQPLAKDCYNQILEACALIDDLKILPGGDQTEIGERGINLSGGQKARVSLARAVYSDADIFLLDDPLSALDSHVGKHVFEKVLSDNGMLKGKTRFLVTHALSCLPYVDEIFVMNNGEIQEHGSYSELIERQGVFAKFLEEHVEDDRKKDKTDRKFESKIPVEIEEKNLQNPSKTTNNLTKDENLVSGSISLKVYMRYIKNAGVFISIVGIISIILYQAFSIMSNVSLTSWAEDKNSTNPEVRDMYLAIYGGLGIGQTFFMVLAALVVAIATINSSNNFHGLLTKNVLRLPMLFFETNPLGRVMNRFSRDIDLLDNTIPHYLRRYLIAFMDTIAVLVVIVIATPLFAVFIIPIAVVYYLLQMIYISAYRQLKRLESIWRSPIYSHFGETLSGLPLIRATKSENQFIQQTEEKIDDNQKCCFAFYSVNRWLSIALQIIGAFIVLITALFAVLGRNEISAALAALSLTYALQVSQSLRIFVRMSSEMETHIIAVERIDEYINMPQEAAWKKEKMDLKWPQKGVIEFDNLQFRYRDGLNLALKGISFIVRSQEKIGIVGRTGAGKSSLTLALFRIVEPAGGRILIDEIDISEIGLHDLRSCLTIIPQDPVLFSGTLRMNVDPFENYSDDAIWTALKHSHLKEFVANLPSGLNHEISENGENLSVGQRQLVCLARALLKKTKILILDEATAAIDFETDEIIQKTIREQFSDCTILTIAHRINTILDSDRILLLENGEIAEYDTPENLLRDEASKFYSLAKEAGIQI